MLKCLSCRQETKLSECEFDLQWPAGHSRDESEHLCSPRSEREEFERGYPVAICPSHSVEGKS